jgi:hypothetical protein
VKKWKDTLFLYWGVHWVTISHWSLGLPQVLKHRTDYRLSRWELRFHSTIFHCSSTYDAFYLAARLVPSGFLFTSCSQSSHSFPMLCRGLRQFCISIFSLVWLCNFSMPFESPLLLSNFFCFLNFSEIFISVYSSSFYFIALLADTIIQLEAPSHHT